MRAELALFMIVGPAGALGCRSMAVKTAPYVGCEAYEITISDEARIGHAYTWTATCQGRTYQCSHEHQTTECTDTSSPRASTYAPDPPKDEGPKIAATPPPSGAAGFDFGADIAAASKACTDAGKAWKELPQGAYECSGTPADVGFAAAVRVDGCSGKVCGVQLVAEVSPEGASKLVAQYAKVRTALAQKYGNVFATVSKGMSGACASEELGACFADGRAAASSTWRWRTGHTLEIVLGKGAGTAPALRVIYQSSPSTGAGQPRLDNL